jgi:hypothetical protein
MWSGEIATGRPTDLTLRCSARKRRASKGEAPALEQHPSRPASRAPQDEEFGASSLILAMLHASEPLPRQSTPNPSQARLCLLKKRRRRSAERRVHWKPHCRRYVCVKPANHLRCGARSSLSPACGRTRQEHARLSALLRGIRRGFSPGSAKGPRFLESPGANGRTLPGTSAASTSQSDHAPDGSLP